MRRKRHYRKRSSLQTKEVFASINGIPSWLQSFTSKYPRRSDSIDDSGFDNVDLPKLESSVRIDRKRKMDQFFNTSRIVGYFVPLEIPENESASVERKLKRHRYKGVRKRGYKRRQANTTCNDILEEESTDIKYFQCPQVEISTSISLPCSPNPETYSKIRFSSRTRLRRQEEAQTDFYSTKFLSPRSSSSFLSSRGSCKLCLFSRSSALMNAKCNHCLVVKNLNAAKRRNGHHLPTKGLQTCLVV